LLRRLKIDINKSSIVPAILNYNYVTFIRARGEILIKYELENKADWVELMKTKDEDFCRWAGCDLKELRNLQTGLAFTREYD
jgi:hypothetical protein